MFNSVTKYCDDIYSAKNPLDRLILHKKIPQLLDIAAVFRFIVA